MDLPDTGPRRDEPQSRLAPTPNDSVVLYVNNGRYPTTTEGLSEVIATYLPSSLFNLQEILASRTGRDVSDYAEYDLARCLIVLASFDYPPKD